MSVELLGRQFDIHGGGMDLLSTHHENELAQSDGAFHPDGHRSTVRYWLHNGFVQVQDEKMSKSLGNFETIRQVLERVDGEVLRFFLLRAHYRSPINYSATLLDEARREVLPRAEQRTPLPPGVDVGDPADIASEVEDMRAALVDALAEVDATVVADALASRHRAGQRPAPVPPVATVAAAADVIGRRLRPREHLAARVVDVEGRRVLVSRAGRLPLRAQDAASVAGWLAGDTDVVLEDGLARRLLLAGVGTLPDLVDEG